VYCFLQYSALKSKTKGDAKMSTVSSERDVQGQMTRVILSSMIGTAIEWYDFFLYGTIATLVFPKLFFPESDPFVGTLLALFTFLVGFIARPIGGAFFGHFGVRISWLSILFSSLLLLCLSTLLIVVLLGYGIFGVAASALAVFRPF